MSNPSGPAGAPTAEDSAVGEEHQQACAACRHPLPDHDDLGLRFCAATESGAIPRACICRT